MYAGYVCNYSVVQKYRNNDTYITFIKSKEQMKICFHAKNRLGLTSKIFSKYFCFKNDKKVRIVILTNITGLFNWNLDTLVKINFIYISHKDEASNAILQGMKILRHTRNYYTIFTVKINSLHNF